MPSSPDATQIPVYRLAGALGRLQKEQYLKDRSADSSEGRTFLQGTARRARSDYRRGKAVKRLQEPFSSPTQRIMGGAGAVACLSLFLPYLRVPLIGSISGFSLLAGMLDAPNFAVPLRPVIGDLADFAGLLRIAAVALLVLLFEIGRLGFTRWPPSRVLNGILVSATFLFVVEFIFRLEGLFIGVGLRVLRLSLWIVLLTSIAALFERVDTAAWRQQFEPDEQPPA